MKSQVYLNGRFFNQAITGVQCFATEVTASIDRLVEQGNWPESVVFIPRSPSTVASTDRSSFRRLHLSQVGRLRGHLWEQAELPVASRCGILVNLGTLLQCCQDHARSLSSTMPEYLTRPSALASIRSRSR